MYKQCVQYDLDGKTAKNVMPMLGIKEALDSFISKEHAFA